MRDRTQRFGCLRRFAGHNAQVEFRKLRRIAGGSEVYVKTVRTGDAETSLVEGARMVGPAHVSPDVAYLRQMRGIKPADGSARDDANTLHLSGYALMCDAHHTGRFACARPLQRAVNSI